MEIVGKKNLDLEYQIIVLDKNDRLFAGTQYEGIYMSDDNGESWKQIGLPIPK